jgi:hypothetical protein
MFKRIYAIFVSRNREFVRDRSSLAWNLLLPVGLVLGLSFAFDGQRDEYTVGVLQAEAEIDPTSHPFLETRYIGFVPYEGTAKSRAPPARPADRSRSASALLDQSDCPQRVFHRVRVATGLCANAEFCHQGTD